MFARRHGSVASSASIGMDTPCYVSACVNVNARNACALICAGKHVVFFKRDTHDTREIP